MLKSLGRNVQHLQKLVEKIIEENTNLRTETGIKLERREFDLWPLVEALIHDLHPVAGTGSTKLVNKVPHHLVVYADASLLRRVFQNLIANAIRFTPRGKVLIEARELKGEDVVECRVSDNGAGFPPERLEKVFDELENDSQNEGGLGLGLAIVKTFIEAHRGKVTVESKQGVGSTFQFTLPRDANVKPMITGAHSIIYSKNPEADRAFFRDVLQLTNVDVGDGWLIFGLPPAEVAVHPSDENDQHEFYLMCDDIEAFVAQMKKSGIACGPVDDQGWGLLSQLTLPGGGKLGVYQPRHARPKPMR